jgi:hypothetical protein
MTTDGANTIPKAEPLVSAILLNYARPYHIEPIVASLFAHPFIDEVIIWDNAPADGAAMQESVGLRGGRRRVHLRGKQNVFTFGRFCAAKVARNDILYTQDDDVIVRNVPEIYRRFLEMQTLIVAGLVENHFRVEAHKTPWLQLGWGSMFRKPWLDCIAPYIEKYGQDNILHRKFDRIFTTLYGNHDPLLADVERLRDASGRDSDRDQNSLWLRQDHAQLTQIAVARAQGLKVKCA